MKAPEILLVAMLYSIATNNDRLFNITISAGLALLVVLSITKTFEKIRFEKEKKKLSEEIEKVLKGVETLKDIKDSENSK